MVMDETLRALADGTRRQILSLVWDREATAGEIAAAFSISRPAVSQHLKVLLDAGLVTVRPQGTRRYYRSNPGSVEAVRSMLDSFWQTSLERLKSVAEAEERGDDKAMASVGTIQKEIFIKAAPETVFSYLTEPSRMSQWMGISHQLEVRVGGAYVVDVTGEAVARGTYTEIDPPHRVVHTWGWDGGEVAPPGSTQVAWDLKAEAGGTRLVMTHTDLPDSVVERHEHGWAHFLERLEQAAAGIDPGADPWVKQAEPATA